MIPVSMAWRLRLRWRASANSSGVICLIARTQADRSASTDFRTDSMSGTTAGASVTGSHGMSFSGIRSTVPCLVTRNVSLGWGLTLAGRR